MRKNLIDELRREGIRDERVLAAIEKVPREEFVPEEFRDDAYKNQALPISNGQTISQPYVVAKMSELLIASGGTNKVLEIGTGSGYQAAILAELFKQVYTIERIRDLFDAAQFRFKKLNYKNINLHFGDGYLGWPEFSLYDAIIGTAAASAVPEILLNQLEPQFGRLIMPIGSPQFPPQHLLLIECHLQEIKQTWLDAVVFVPMQRGIINS